MFDDFASFPHRSGKGPPENGWEASQDIVCETSLGSAGNLLQSLSGQGSQTLRRALCQTKSGELPQTSPEGDKDKNARQKGRNLQQKFTESERCICSVVIGVPKGGGEVARSSVF